MIKKKILFIILVLINLNLILAVESVTYNHPSDIGTSQMDCFDNLKNICLTRNISGSIFNIGTAGNSGIKWGCGKCDNVKKWYSELSNEIKAECFGGYMPSITNENLCLETTNGKWNINFDWFESKGGGGFNYTRTFYSENNVSFNNITNPNNSTYTNNSNDRSNKIKKKTYSSQTIREDNDNLNNNLLIESDSKITSSNNEIPPEINIISSPSNLSVEKNNIKSDDNIFKNKSLIIVLLFLTLLELILILIFSRK